MANQYEFWVFSERPALLAELIGCARRLTTGVVTALVAGPKADAGMAFSLGADKVIWLGELSDHMLEDYVPTIAGLVSTHKPFSLLIGATKRGKAVAGRLAARLEVSAITDVKALEWSEGSLIARHLIFGGGAVREEKSGTDFILATLGLGVAEPLPADPSRSGSIIEAPFVDQGWKVTITGHKPKPATTVNLAAAKRVVCPGRGLAKQEDLGLIEDLAKTLDAEIGCTRPLAEGLDWLPRERYIGVSGAFIKSDLYIGIGVSGQVQHTVGVNDSRIIVAINKDKNAPIFEQSDYGIEGDLYTVLPVLITALKERK